MIKKDRKKKKEYDEGPNNILTGNRLMGILNML